MGILTAVLVAFGSMVFVYAGVVLTRVKGVVEVTDRAARAEYD
ncbi:MAG: hypothetical protein ACE5LH_08325 [Fidelibacterota bacterium]